MTFESAESVVDFLALPAPDLIYQSFLLLLGRAPAISEQEDRERALHLGCGRIAMLADITQSPEAIGYRHAQREQGSDAEFIEKIHQRYLGRPIDPNDLARYMDLMRHKSCMIIEADFAASNEAIDCRSLLYDIGRLVRIYHRSQQWWRWIGRRRRNQQIRNIESEIAVVLTACRSAREHGEVLQAIKAMREQISHHVETTHVAVRHDIARTRENGQADLRAMIERSSDTLASAASALRDQSEHALAALATREAEFRAELDQARIETHNALVLIYDDVQARFDRLVERQLAERAAAVPSIQKVDTAQLGPHARHILNRMQMLNVDGRQA